MFNFFKGQQPNEDDKPPTLPDHLQMSIDLMKSMKTVMSTMIQEEESVAVAQSEIEPLQNQLVNLLQACIEVDKENEKRHEAEINSSKFVMEQVQQQLIENKKEFSDVTSQLNNAKERLAEVEKAANKNDIKLLQRKTESLEQKVENRDQRIESLVAQMEMKEREHETDVARQKAKALLYAAPASDNERVQQLQDELEQTNNELDMVRDELEQAAEDLVAADDQLKEAEQAIYKAAQLEDKLEQLQQSQKTIMKEKNQQLENMETEREMAQMLVGETRNILNDQAEELQASQAHILDLEKQVELTNEQDNLKDELMKTLDALKEKEDQVRSLKDELQNTNEIVEIQAQVLKEKDGNIKSDEFDTNKQRLEDAQDKIDYQAKQIKEQQKKIQTLMAGPSGSRSSLMLSPGVDGDSRRSIMSPSRKSSILLSPHEDGRVTKLEKHVEKWKARALGDAPNDLVGQWDRIEELEQQLENAKSDSRVQNLETQIEESDLHLEEALKEIENQAAEIKDKDVLIRSLEKAEDELEAKVFRIRDEFESTTMSLDDDLDVRDDIIEGLKTELEEAYQNIERLEENQKRGFATDSTQYKERDSFITSLELQLEDSDNTIQKMEHRIASKDHEISSLGSKLEKAQESLAELRSELEQIQERAMSKEEYSALQTALLHAKKSMKKGQKQIKKLSEEVEERKNAAQQLQEMYDEQEQRNIDMLQLQRKYEASQQTIKYLEKGKKEVVDYDEPDHKNEVHALRQKEADDANTMEERNREIVALRDELETIKQKTTKLVKNSEEMEKVVQLKEDEKDRLDATVCELKKELEVSNSLITSLRVEMKALESSVHSKSSKRLKKEKSMNELKIQIKQLSMELQTTKAERDKALIGNDTEIEELRNELRSSVQYSEGNDKRLAGLKKQLDESRQSVERTKKSMARDSKTISQFQNDLHELTSKLNENEDCLQKKQEELEKANELIMKLEEQIQKAKENRVDPISRRSEVHAGNDIDAISSLENEIGLKEKDIMIKELEQEIQNLATSRITESEIFKTTDWLQSTTPDQTEELVKLKKELKTLEETTESLRKREEQTKRRLSKQQEMDKELDKSIKLLEEKEREIKNLKDDLEKEKTKIKDLKEVLVVDGGKVSDLEARLENEVKRGQILLSDKQTDLVVHANELKHKAQRIKELESSLPQEHEPMNNGQSAFDVKSDLEREIRKSSMLNKQIETFKISLNSKRKIIESQETEVINSQKRLHKANRKIRHLENEVYYQLSDLVALETKLDGVYLKSRYKGKNPRGRNYERRKSRGNPRVRRGGGMGNDFDFEKRRRRPKHQRDKQSEILVGGEISVDDLSVNQCLDLFKKKMTTARRQLEAVQDKISHNDAWDKHKRRGR